MKKFLLILLVVIFCFGMFAPANASFAESESGTFIVTADVVSVYSEASLTSEKIASLKHKDEIQIECIDGEPKVYSSNSFIFYKVENAEEIGYILADLVVPKNEFLVTIPQFNAKTNGVAKVFTLQDGVYVENDRGISLPKHQRIFLYEGFNRKKAYIAVAFVYENEVVYGYLQKEKIDPDGINPVIITVACLAIAAIGIILALVFMKKKKPKIAKPKNR